MYYYVITQGLHSDHEVTGLIASPDPIEDWDAKMGDMIKWVNKRLNNRVRHWFIDQGVMAEMFAALGYEFIPFKEINLEERNQPGRGWSMEVTELSCWPASDED